MVKTTVYLDLDTAIRLKQMAANQKRSQAEIIREILDVETRKQQATVLPPGMGSFRSNFTDTSERAEEILEEAAEKGAWL